MNLRDAATQALEAWDRPHGINYIDFRPYMDALRAALAEPVQEPVAWAPTWAIDRLTGKMGAVADPVTWGVDAPLYVRETRDCLPLYAAPPQRKPLTEEEMQTIYREFMLYQDGLTPSGLQRVGRAIERAHGIWGDE